MEDLLKQGKLTAGSLANVGGTPVAIAIRKGAPKPNIGTVDALKHTLIAAKSISYADPAKGGASGVYFAKVLAQLASPMNSRRGRFSCPAPRRPSLSPRAKPNWAWRKVAEIVSVAGAEMLGPLPGNLGSVTLFTAGVATAIKDPIPPKHSSSSLLDRTQRPS